MDMISLVVLSGCAFAGPTDHGAWTYSVTTNGENVSWTSPTPMRPSGGHYEMLYTINSATVMVSYFGLTFGPIDVTDQIPIDVLETWREAIGPCPLDFGWTTVIAPPDQNPPSISFDWIVELDASGMVTYRMENVFRGQADHDLGWPWGVVTVNIESGTINSTLAIDIVPTPCYADINGSGSVDVIDLLDVIASWGYCLGCAADTNQDAYVDVTDLLAIVGSWGPCP